MNTGYPFKKVNFLPAIRCIQWVALPDPCAMTINVMFFQIVWISELVF